MEAINDWTQRASRVADSIGEYSAAHDADDSFVDEGFDALRSESFFAALVPSELGGGGATTGDMCEAIRIIAQACGSTALAFSMHCHLVATNVWRWKHESAPTEGLLRRIASEGLILASSGGSDWLESGGVAEKVEGGFSITARKPFASGSPRANVLATSAVFDDPDGGPTVIHFALPLSTDGVESLSTWRVLGMRGTGSNDILLKDVFIADGAITARRPKGKWHLLFHVITMVALPLIYSTYVGLAEAARDVALATAAKRPLDRHLPMLVGRMENALRTAQLAQRRMAEIASDGTPGPATTNEVTSLRTLVGQKTIETVELAMQVAGGGSFYRTMGLERIWRDVQAARFHPLQESAQLEFAGRCALGWDIDGPSAS